MAMNTWRSKGAGKRQLALGLGKVEIVLENQDQVQETNERLNYYQLNSTYESGVTKVEDPWGNTISLLAKPEAF
jgi:catechol 2,3-dioxygenase